MKYFNYESNSKRTYRIGAEGLENASIPVIEVMGDGKQLYEVKSDVRITLEYTNGTKQEQVLQTGTKMALPEQLVTDNPKFSVPKELDGKLAEGDSEAKKYINKHKQAVEEAKDKLKNGVKDFLQSEHYKEYLDFVSKMPSYSWRNTLLVFLQKPEATMVMTAKQWNQRFERMVNKGEHSEITLLRPQIASFDDLEKFDTWCENHPYFWAMQERRTELEKTGHTEFVIGYTDFKVFDISQTNGKEIERPEICPLLDGEVSNYESIRDAITSVARKNGVSVAFHTKEQDSTLKGGARGYFSALTDNIVILDGMSEKQTISTMVHELAHALLHGKEMKVQGIADTGKSFRDIRELQAESVAYVVCQKFDIETETKSFGYIASWIDTGDEEKNIKKMEQSLDVISKCSMSIIEGLEKDLTREKAEFVKETEEEEMELA